MRARVGVRAGTTARQTGQETSNVARLRRGLMMGDGDGDGSGIGKDAPTYRRKGGGVGDCGGGWFEHPRQWLGLHWAGLSL